MTLEQIRDHVVRSLLSEGLLVLERDDALQWLDTINAEIEKRELLNQFVSDMKEMAKTP